ncbi:MAG: HD domain-containing protein [Deltaproteobacteria bacterium]|nr:HD domain-containing protein [Deltaproteobacteria bacterium]
MRYTLRKSEGRKSRWRFSPGIRLKLIAFLLPLVFLLVVSVAATVTRITDSAIRRDLLQRGVAISRVVAFSAGYSLLSGDRLALDSLAAETKNSAADIEYVSIRDMGDTVLAHSRIEERGKGYLRPAGAKPLGTFVDTRADEAMEGGRALIEFTTPILFSGKRVGTVSLSLSKKSLVTAQEGIRRSIIIAASVVLGIALLSTLALASVITTPVKKLSSGVNDLASGATFRPIPVRWGDELGELTRNFNRMAETILAQQNRLSRYAKEVEEAYVSLVRVIAASIDARDPYTLGHSTRVARISCEMGRKLGFSGEELEHLEKACLFHDVGKIRTPDDILLKGYSLTSPEVVEMRAHPGDGAEILRMAPSLHRYIAVVRSHHEWYNGQGYPDGKKGSEIPIHSQIIALADAFDAMTSTRPYRKGLTPGEAIEEILRFRGTQFSPELTDVFVRMAKDLPVLETEEWKGMAL